MRELLDSTLFFEISIYVYITYYILLYDYIIIYIYLGNQKPSIFRVSKKNLVFSKKTGFSIINHNPIL